MISVCMALSFLDPEVVSRLLGRSPVAQKARALILHDQWLTHYPRMKR